MPSKKRDFFVRGAAPDTALAREGELDTEGRRQLLKSIGVPADMMDAALALPKARFDKFVERLQENQDIPFVRADRSPIKRPPPAGQNPNQFPQHLHGGRMPGAVLERMRKRRKPTTKEGALTRAYKHGGNVSKRKPREFAKGGMYKGKSHMYAAGGRVTDTRNIKRSK